MTIHTTIDGRSVATSPDDAVPDAAYPTLAELRRTDAFAETRLLTPDGSLGDRIVRAVSVQEGPLEDFVRKGELVLTTGIRIGDDEAGLADFVRQVAAAGASGLGIAVPRHIPRIPPWILGVATERRLAILEVPWHLRFSDLIECALRVTVDRQQALLRQSEDVRRLLTRVVLDGADPAHLARSLEVLTRRPVRIRDRWGDSIGASDAWQDAPAEGIDSLPIVAQGRTLGNLDIGSPLDGRDGLADPDERIVDHGVTSAALMILTREAAAEGEARGRSEVLSALLHGWSTSERERELRASAVGIDPGEPHIVVCVSVEGDPDEGMSAAEAGRWAIERAARARRLTLIQSWNGAVGAIILEVADAIAPRAINGLADDARRFLSLQRPGRTMTFGVGRAAPSLGQLPDSHEQARNALRLGMAMRGPGSLTEFGELGAFPTIVQALAVDDTAKAFGDLISRTLGRIEAYEASTGLPLMDTLVAYFDANGNVSATARRLRINRHSLLYRLSKITTLGAISFDDPLDRFAIELAVRTRQVVDLGADGPTTLPTPETRAPQSR